MVLQQRLKKMFTSVANLKHFLYLLVIKFFGKDLQQPLYLAVPHMKYKVVVGIGTLRKDRLLLVELL